MTEPGSTFITKCERCETRKETAADVPGATHYFEGSTKIIILLCDRCRAKLIGKAEAIRIGAQTLSISDFQDLMNEMQCFLRGP